jgi:hypothetical protein
VAEGDGNADGVTRFRRQRVRVRCFSRRCHIDIILRELPIEQLRSCDHRKTRKHVYESHGHNPCAFMGEIDMY